jgi:hypothetical protein
VTPSAEPRDPWRLRLRHAVQREIGRLLSPLWIPGVAVLLRLVAGYRIEDAEALRAEFRRIRRETRGPLLICANHLTLIDSALIAWALGSPAWYLRHFRDLAWNLPERRNFAATPWSRALTYLLKCIPITRGGDRREVADALERVRYLLARGETALVFPEAGRTRTGRIEAGAAAWGVGRILGALPGCRVVCVYLRGEGQATYSDTPARGERFRGAVSCLEPKSEQRGVRRSVDLARQVVSHLMQMERDWFDARQRRR